MQYDKEELELLDAIENDKLEKVPFDNDKLKKMSGETLDYITEKKQINLQLNRADFDFIKQKADDIGIDYKNIIQSLVHNYSVSKIQLKI
jgi:predicted DNA binding CopG/RHH family protein